MGGIHGVLQIGWRKSALFPPICLFLFIMSVLTPKPNYVAGALARSDASRTTLAFDV